jgi:hypothetical protein
LPRHSRSEPVRFAWKFPVKEKETPVSKKVVVSVSLVVIAVSVILTCQAAAPLKIAAVAPIADLVAETDVRIKAIEEALATEQSYLQSKGTTIPSLAGVLAVVAQAVAESEETATWKAAAPSLRDAAIAVANAKTYAEAKQGLAAIKEAQGGKAGAAKPDAEWNKLCKLGALMKEVNSRNTKLRRAKTSLPANTEEASRDASVLAVLALAAHDDTHEVKDKAQIPDWQKFSKEFSAHMTGMAAAFKKRDKEGAAAGFKKANDVCNACHDKFRDAE